MSTALVSSIYDFGDHVSYRTNNASTLQNQKNGFGSQVERKTNLTTTVYNSVQANNNNNNNINIVNNNVSRRIVTASASVPIGITAALASHRSLPTQPSNTTVHTTAMHPKTSIGVMSNNNTQPSPVALVRGVSTGSQTCNAINNNNNTMNNGNININNKEHKKLDRSYSEPAEKSQQVLRLNSSTSVAGPMSSRYKTELCRSFAEVGTCKYGDKCQFAHGGHELRVITRHPKFKTENCKSFHSTGFCPYGPRCHFIHNSEESKKNILNNLQSNGCNGVNTANGCQPRCGNDQIITTNMTNMANLNGNTAVTNNGFPATYHSSNNNSIPLRPKALSIGSYSLCSSGEISPPSSQSGSPTSLNSFFTEDTFNSFASPTNHALGSCANNAFSFSPDFASLVQSTQIKNNGLSTFDTTPSTLCQAFPLSTSLAADMCDQQQVSPLYSSAYTTSVSTPLDHNHVNDTISGMRRTVTGTPPLAPLPQPIKAVSAPVLHPTSPESPVDSIASDVETLRLESHHSPSPIPTCSSPHDISKKGILRLPIFTRFANNSTNSSNNELE
jgi:butyrate response factor 1